jgi:cation transport ATPase
VLSASVNLVSATASVTVAPGGAGPRDIISAIEDAGFEATLLPPGAPRPGGAEAPLAREARAWRARLVLSALLSAPVMALSMAGMVPGWMEVVDAPSRLLAGLPWSWAVQAVFSTAVQVVVGAAFYRSAWAGLKRREPNMQVRWGGGSRNTGVRGARRLYGWGRNNHRACLKGQPQGCKRLQGLMGAAPLWPLHGLW